MTPTIAPERIARAIAAPPAPSGARTVSGGSWILDQPEGTPAVWGEGSRVLWAMGEPCYVFGPPGVGKSTVAQQVALARIGIRPATFLGLPVVRDERALLYLACDRPKQIARSLRRMVTPEDRATLDDRLIATLGPPPFDVLADATALLNLAREVNAGTVIIDSLKDIAASLEAPETGARVNVALQHLVASGIEVLVLHHGRKASADGKRGSGLDVMFGSTWLAAGAGSIIGLRGDAGDLVVEMHHLKQPAEPFGPLTLQHEHERGITTVIEQPDPLAILRRAGRLTAQVLASSLTGNPDPSRADVAKARRHLERLVTDGLAHRQDGNPTRGVAHTYVAAARP